MAFVLLLESAAILACCAAANLVGTVGKSVNILAGAAVADVGILTETVESVEDNSVGNDLKFPGLEASRDPRRFDSADLVD